MLFKRSLPHSVYPIIALSVGIKDGNAILFLKSSGWKPSLNLPFSRGAFSAAYRMACAPEVNSAILMGMLFLPKAKTAIP